MRGQFATINSRNALEAHIEKLRAQWEEHKWLQVQVTTEKQKSQLQFNALHVYCEWLAQELNTRGLGMEVVLRHHPSIEWTKDAVKEKIWKPVYKAKSNKNTTTQGSTTHYTETYEEINKFIGEHFGFYVPWPSKEMFGGRKAA